LVLSPSMSIVRRYNSLGGDMAVWVRRKSVGCCRVLLESALIGGQFAACKAFTGGTTSEQKNMHN
jgi:hypothetical protein